MQLLEQHLAQLVEEGQITSDSAMSATNNPSITLSTSGGVRIPEPVA
jgi:Tfp pilus assembly pilus retraction ATPase PilT